MQHERAILTHYIEKFGKENVKEAHGEEDTKALMEAKTPVIYQPTFRGAIDGICVEGRPDFLVIKCSLTDDVILIVSVFDFVRFSSV